MSKTKKMRPEELRLGMRIVVPDIGEWEVMMVECAGIVYEVRTPNGVIYVSEDEEMTVVE